MVDPVRFTQEYGILVGVLMSFLASLLLGIWKLTQWALTNVVIPIRDGHLTYLKEESEAKKAANASYARQAEALEGIQGTQRQIVTDTGVIKENITKIWAALPQPNGQAQTSGGSR